MDSPLLPTTPSSPAPSIPPARISTPEAWKTVSDLAFDGIGGGAEGRVFDDRFGYAWEGVSSISAAVTRFPRFRYPRAQPTPGSSTVIDTWPPTALPDYDADDDEAGKRERPHSWLAEVRDWEELVLGGLAEEADGQNVPSSSSAARPRAGMGELKSPGLFSVSTGTTAAESSLSGSTRKNTFDEERGAEGLGKVPFPRSRSWPREMGLTSAGYAMRMGSSGGGRTLSSVSRIGLEIFERDGRVRDNIDSTNSMDSTSSSNGGAMDLEELSILTAHVFS